MAADETPTPTPTPAPDPAAAAALAARASEDPPEQIQLSRGEYDALVAARAEAEAQKYADQAKGRTAEQRLQAVESMYRTSAVRGAIAEALGGVQFVNDEARTDVMALAAQEVEPREVDGQIIAWHRPSNRPLASIPRNEFTKRFNYAIRADARGGSGATSRGGQSMPDGGDAPAGSVAERMIELTKQQRPTDGPLAAMPGFGRRQ